MLHLIAFKRKYHFLAVKLICKTFIMEQKSSNSLQKNYLFPYDFYTK